MSKKSSSSSGKPFSPLCRIQLHLIGYRCIRNEQLFLRYLCFFHSYREGMHLARHQNRFLSFFQYSGLKQHKFVSHHILFSAESDQWSKNGTLGFRIQIDRSWHKFSFLSPRYSDDFLCMIIVAHHFHVQRHIRSKHFLFEFMNDFKQNIIHFTSSSTIFNLERNWLKSISL